MSTSPPSEDATAAGERTRKLIEAGSEVAGAASSGALSLVVGPLAAPAGVAITRSLKWVGSEFHDRWLAPRQRVRIGGALAVAADDIKQRMEAGDQPRPDWFPPTGEPSGGGEEVLEATLMNAANAYEERKVPYMGKLFASLAFSSFETAFCHYLTGIASDLTYRQLTSLAVISEGLSDFRLFEETHRGATILENGLEAELDELGQRGLIGFRQKDGSIARPSATFGGGHMRGMEAEGIAPTQTGRLLAERMGLEQLPQPEKEALVISLQVVHIEAFDRLP